MCGCINIYIVCMCICMYKYIVHAYIYMYILAIYMYMLPINRQTSNIYVAWFLQYKGMSAPLTHLYV